jgi:hypothetical protein
MFAASERKESIMSHKTGRVDVTPRVMWMLNHTSARKFEVPMLRSLGYEVFTPKSFPNDPNFRSASIDWSEDGNLTIPAAELIILNEADWYSGANEAAWEIANKYFDLAFFFLFNLRGVERLCRKFNGQLLWRTYGLASEFTYSDMLDREPYYLATRTALRRSGQRIWFAEAYDHLHEVENEWIRHRAIYLPLGLAGASKESSVHWTGGDKRVLFVCPDIGFNTAYAEIYDNFKREFQDFPYAVGGVQSTAVNDPRVLGYLPLDAHIRNMTEMQVMFYHSSEPRHIHYHPFEAVKAGMPLVFMAGGILDRMGGVNLPGRARNWKEARKKVRRLLDGDVDFCQQVRASQAILLEGMKGENLVHHWVESLSKVGTAAKQRVVVERDGARRIAILTEPRFEGWTLAIASALEDAAENKGLSVSFVIGVDTDGDIDATNFSVRRFEWKPLSQAQAKRSLLYSGRERWLQGDSYLAPDDQVNYFQDSDVWLIVGNSKQHPILPLKPIVVILPEVSKEHKAHDDVKSLKPAGIGFEQFYEAVFTVNEDAKDRIIKMEGIESELVHVLDRDAEFTDLLEKVLECL